MKPVTLSEKFTFALSTDLYSRLKEKASMESSRARISITPGHVIRSLLERELNPERGGTTIVLRDDVAFVLERVADDLGFSIDELAERMIVEALPVWVDRSKDRFQELVKQLKGKRTHDLDRPPATQPRLADLEKNGNRVV